MTAKIDAHRYKGFRDSVRGDRLVKLINVMLRSAECELVLFRQMQENPEFAQEISQDARENEQ